MFRQIGPTEAVMILIILGFWIAAVAGIVYVASRVWHRGARDATRRGAKRRRH